MQLIVDAVELKALVRDVIRETLAELRASGETLGIDRDGPIAISEAEAAHRLGLQRHQLRDQRLKGRVPFSRGPRGRILYRTSDLEAYLAARRVEMD